MTFLAHADSLPTMSSFWSEPPQEKPTYRTALVCLSGHTATDRLEEAPETAERYCSECGSKTIRVFPKCGEGIRGDYHVPSVAAIGFEYSPPNHCHHCGSQFPWTRARIDAAKEMAGELDLSDQDRETLKGAIDDLSSDTPRTEVAVLRYKRIVGSVGKTAGNALNSIMVAVITEAAKKLLYGP